MTENAPTPSSEWADRYQLYLAQAAANAARIQDRYREIIARITAGDLPHQVLEERLPTFLQLHGTSYATELADVSMRFLTGLVESGTTYSYELLDRVAPDTVTRPTIIAPSFDMPTDWTAWFGRLTEFAARHSAVHVGMIRAVMDRVAVGVLVPADVQARAADFNDEHLSGSVSDTVRLYFELISGLDRIAFDYAERYLSSVLGDDRHDEFVLTLAGPVGRLASVRLAVANVHDEVTAVRCVLTDFRRDDGVGPAFVPDVLISPERFELAPRDERTVTVQMRLADDAFVAGVRYVGTLHVLAPAETLLAVRVHVMPSESYEPVALSAQRPSER